MRCSVAHGKDDVFGQLGKEGIIQPPLPPSIPTPALSLETLMIPRAESLFPQK